MTTNMKLTLVLRPNPLCHVMTCSICGSDFRSPVVPTLEGSGNSHHLCQHCVFLSQEELLKKAKEFRNFLSCWCHVQSTLCTWLEHAKLEERPSREDLDLEMFNAQLEQAEGESENE